MRGLTFNLPTLKSVKQRYSAFFGTDLDEILRARGTETVVVLGLTTNVCVQSTARDAWQRDYRTITLDDCCSEIGEGSHATSLAWPSPNFGSVCASREVSARWEGRLTNASTARSSFEFLQNVCPAQARLPSVETLSSDSS
jgi:isochorismate hydrolase